MRVVLLKKIWLNNKEVERIKEEESKKNGNKRQGKSRERGNRTYEFFLTTFSLLRLYVVG
jgi:hypothetical protein